MHDADVISITDNKVALTEHMDTLISAVMQQSGSSEVQSPSLDNEQRSSRGKRKNDTEDSDGTLKDTETAGDTTAQKTKTKKVSGTDKPRKEKKTLRQPKR